MNPALSDDTLNELLHHAGLAYDVPAAGPDRVLAGLDPHPARRPLAGRRVLQLAAAAAVVLLAVTVVKAGGGAGPTSSTAGGGVSSDAGLQGDGGTLSTGKVATGALGAPLPAAVPGPQVGAPSRGTGSTVEQPAADGARIVKTGTIVLVAPDGKVSVVLADVTRVVTGAHGYLSSSNSEEAGSSPSGTLTMRVPESSYESVVRQVRLIGAKVVSVASGGRDVTATYADTQAQIGSLTAARNRFLVILGQARTIGETLAVQQRVDDVQGQIDRLEGQRRVLADQSDLATLTVTVSEDGDGTLVVTPRSGLSQAWHDAVHGFTSGVEAIVARSGRAVVVLLCLGVLLLALRFGWRVARRARL